MIRLAVDIIINLKHNRKNQKNKVMAEITPTGNADECQCGGTLRGE